MFAKKIYSSLLVPLCIFFLHGLIMTGAIQAWGSEKDEYRQDLVQIQSMRESLNPALNKEAFQKNPDSYMKQVRAFREKNDLNVYEEFADSILNKWASKNAEHYGRLALELCEPLTSGSFTDKQGAFALARNYALSSLEKSDEISPELELELTGRVITLMIGPNAPKGQNLAIRRRKDVEVRLHAWKRLLGTIDPAWDPSEQLSIYPDPPREIQNWNSGMDPNAIKDPVIRAEYKTALAENQRKIEEYVEQNRLHEWAKRYPKQAEEYIVQAYSTAPYNNEELVQFLDDFKFDKATKTRIINEVAANIQKSVNAGQNRTD